MRTTMTTLALASLLTPAHAATPPITPCLAAPAQVELVEETPTRKESALVITFYHPHCNALALRSAAIMVTRSEVEWDDVHPVHGLIPRQRERFVMVGDSILVQDFPDGSREAMELLSRLDKELDREVKGESKNGANAITRTTLRLKRLDTMSAVQLISSSQRAVQIGYSDGVPVLTLSGSAADVQAATALVEEAERPLPQILMQWSLIEPVDPADLGDGEVASDELVAALSPLAPNKTFKRSGSFVVRGSAGGGARLEVASSISSIQGTTPKQPGEVLLHTRISGWEPETRQLNLSDCEVTILRRTTLGTSTTSTTDKLSTDLSMREGETTVIGSLGSDQVFVALTITVIE